MKDDLLKRRQNLFIIDFDVPREPKSKRMAFYRQLTKIRKQMGLFGKMSTMSVLVTVDRHLAEKVYYLASQYGQANIYVGRKLDI
jgi:hypothetical protein